VTFGRNALANFQGIDLVSDGDDLTGELMPCDHWNRHRGLGPFVPFVYVQIRAADTGSIDLDQNIVGTDLGLRRIDHPNARLGLLFR